MQGEDWKGRDAGPGGPDENWDRMRAVRWQEVRDRARVDPGFRCETLLARVDQGSGARPLSRGPRAPFLILLLASSSATPGHSFPSSKHLFQEALCNSPSPCQRGDSPRVSHTLFQAPPSQLQD